jgi:hypothetical protein
VAATKTNVFMDIVSCQFQYTPPAGGGPVTVPLNEIVAAEPSLRGTRKTFSGGAAAGPRVKKIVDRERMVTLRGADLFTAMSVPQGVLGTLTFTINDLYNGIGTGAINVTMSNCSLDESGVQQEHNEIGKYSMTFSAVWTDGITDPLAVTQST